MSKKKIWSGVLPLTLLIVVIGGIFLIGRIGVKKDATIDEIGKETIGSTIDGGGKRMIRIKYEVNGRTYIEGVGKPFSFIHPNEKFRMKYLPNDPESIVVFFDQPYISDEFAYLETKCTSISKNLSVLNFEYQADGRTIKRKTLYRDHQLSDSVYKVVYRKNNPEIGYLVKR